MLNHTKTAIQSLMGKITAHWNYKASGAWRIRLRIFYIEQDRVKGHLSEDILVMLGRNRFKRKPSQNRAQAARPLNEQLSLTPAPSGEAAQATKTQSSAEHSKRVVLRYCLRGHPDLHGETVCRECAAPVTDQCQHCGKKISIDLSPSVFAEYDLEKRREIFVRERPLYCTCKARFPWTWRVKWGQITRRIVNIVSAGVFLKLLEMVCDWLMEAQK